MGATVPFPSNFHHRTIISTNIPRVVVLFLLILKSSFAMDIDKFTAPTTICGYLPFTKIRDYAVLDLVSLAYGL